MTIVPHEQLSQATLEALVEEFVTRDGAVHGHSEASAAQMSEEIMRQIKSGLIVIVYDDDTQTCTIIPKEKAPLE